MATSSNGAGSALARLLDYDSDTDEGPALPALPSPRKSAPANGSAVAVAVLACAGITMLCSFFLSHNYSVHSQLHCAACRHHFDIHLLHGCEGSCSRDMHMQFVHVAVMTRGWRLWLCQMQHKTTTNENSHQLLQARMLPASKAQHALAKAMSFLLCKHQYRSKI